MTKKQDDQEAQRRRKVKGRATRGRNALPDAERKDRLIQTRVAEDLDQTLRQVARKQRVTVSQLIRNVLEDTFHLVDNIVAETANFTETVKRDARRIAASAQGKARPDISNNPPTYPIGEAHADAMPPIIESVAAWQDVTLNRDVRCARCQRRLTRGERALFGVQEDPTAPKLWLCPTCGTLIGV
jgi:hypothetical protein